jgi:hypothetical protein
MPSLFDPPVRGPILERISRLTPDRKPGWGRFTAPEMVCHISCDMRSVVRQQAPTSASLMRPTPWPAITRAAR